MTKRILSVVLVALMCVSMLAPLLSLEADAADSYKAISFSTPVAVGDNGGYPRLENLPDGTLLLASSSSTSVLRLMRSSDNGKSWGKSETIVDYTGTDYKPGNGYLFYDTQTETLFFTYRCPIESTDSRGNVISYTANINYFHSAHYRDHDLALSPLTDNHDEIILFLRRCVLGGEKMQHTNEFVAEGVEPCQTEFTVQEYLNSNYSN